MKRKLMIMGACVLVLILLFVGGIIKKIAGLDGTDSKIILRNGDMITTEETTNLVTCLGLEKEQIEEVIGDNEYLKFGQCIKILELVDEKYKIDTSKVTKQLSFSLEKESKNKAVLTAEFLDLYENILKEIPDDTIPVVESTFFVLGDSKEDSDTDSNNTKSDDKESSNRDTDKIESDDKESSNRDADKIESDDKESSNRDTDKIESDDKESSNSESDKSESDDTKSNSSDTNETESNSEESSYLITDIGDYSYQKTKSFENFYKNGALNLTSESENNSENTEQSEDSKQLDHTFNPSDYIDHKVKAITYNNEIVYIKEVLEEEAVLHNTWIISGKGGTISAFLNNIKREFPTKYDLSQDIEGKIGDLVIQDGKVIKISIKPEIIKGKVLVANKKYIEIKGYGRIPLDDNYKIYKIYNELSMELTNSILVGYNATDFVVADGKIVAALITEPIKAENIRVLIKTDNFQDIFHKKVVVTCNKDFVVTVGDKKTTYDKGTEITFTMDGDWEKQERVLIESKSETGKIKLLSVKRADGNPAYRGSIEIASTDQGFVIINELPLEEYLYAVIPSEMPTYYGLEALKVQAICARSYAYNQLLANSYNEYGAHVDDSVAYQVYNNISENKDTILAVKDTYGKIIQYKDSVVMAYYFSTSCGHTASLEEVWNNAGNADYLVGKMQTVTKISKDDSKDNTAEVIAQEDNSDTDNNPDFSVEKNFKEFIQKPTVNTYDSEFPWYRWKVTMSLADIKKTIDSEIEARYNTNPVLIQTLVGKDDKGNDLYESKPVSTIGTVKEIKVGKREKSGIISELILVGSKCTIKVLSEYNIRTLLAPKGNQITRQDNTTTSGLMMLPSAFFIIEKDGKNVKLQGGGYGHGVGMSQNGVKAMTEAGYEYETIIKHYYNGVELGSIY